MFWKNKKLNVTDEVMLRKSLANNKRILPFLNFIWTGFMVLYVILNDLWLLIFACLVAIFIVNHSIAYKVDRARLEFLMLKDEIKLLAIKPKQFLKKSKE